MPEAYDSDLCKDETYRKWDFTPSFQSVLAGSTTDLTVKGFSQHLEQIHACGGQMGVEFHAAPPRGF